MQSPIRTFDTFSQGKSSCNRYDPTIYRNHFPNLSFSPPPSNRCLQLWVVFWYINWVQNCINRCKIFLLEGGCSRAVRPSLLLLQLHQDVLNQPRVMNKCGEFKRLLLRTTRYLSSHQLLTQHGYVREVRQGSCYESGGSGRTSTMPTQLVCYKQKPLNERPEGLFARKYERVISCLE
jgi:hypothetical protein